MPKKKHLRTGQKTSKNKRVGENNAYFRLAKKYSFSQLESLIQQAQQSKNKLDRQKWKKIVQTKEKN